MKILIQKQSRTGNSLNETITKLIIEEKIKMNEIRISTLNAKFAKYVTRRNLFPHLRKPYLHKFCLLQL